MPSKRLKVVSHWPWKITIWKPQGIQFLRKLLHCISWEKTLFMLDPLLNTWTKSNKFKRNWLGPKYFAQQLSLERLTNTNNDACGGFGQTVRLKLCASLFPSYRKAGELTKTVMFLWTLQNDRPTNLPGACGWNFLFGRLLTSFQVAGRLSERTRTTK